MPGGVGDYTACLAEALGHQSIAISILTTAAAKDEPTAAPSGLTPSASVVHRIMPGWGLPDAVRFLRYVAASRPDAIVIQYQTGAYGMKPLPNLIPALLRLLKSRPRVVVVFHDLNEPWLAPKSPWLGRLANRLLARLSDVVVVTNHEDRTKLQTRYGTIRYEELIPIGSNIADVGLGGSARDDARHALGIAPRVIAAGFFGFINEWKGVDTLVEAFARARDRDPRLRLVFIGGSHRPGAAYSFGYADRIRHRIAALGLDSEVTWTEFGDADVISGWLHAIDFIVLPFVGGYSYRHGTLIAAITHGLPIITTETAVAADGRDCDSLPPLRSDETAELVASGDVDALAASMLRLASDPAYRERLSRAVVKLSPIFSWDAIAKQMVRAIVHDAAAARYPPRSAGAPP
ncbi:MAG: glycosyltransferase [Chloroflexota bacterium]|nr:MAG: glycosyltransferase [Chloroflexota bacterium]